MPFQWAAHAGNRLPEAGREYGFPVPTPDSDFDLSVIPECNPSGAQKYWFADPVTEGRCGLFNPLSGITTTIRFSEQTLPYLGIWINEGGWNGYYNVGIESSTCYIVLDVTGPASS